MASGDDIRAGLPTGAESTTNLNAQVPTGDHPTPFNGTVIFEVAKQRGGETEPHQTLDAILGVGGNGPFPSRGGTEVTGIGGPNQGTGVIGKGPGALPVNDQDSGEGGIGVIGMGGSVGGPTFGPVDPGVGVFGQGGLQDDISNTTGQPHAAGITGIAGDGAVPSFGAIGGAGVFGRGANANRKTVTVNGRPGVSGPANSGPGVLGVGATQTLDGTPNGSPSAGVIGLAGDAGFPPFDEASNAGVYGKGGAGVIGVGGADIGSPIIPAGGEGSVGVLGTTRGKSSSGVIAISSGDLNFPSLVAANLTPSPEAQGWAAWFIGNTVATGLKSAAVLHSDGSHRLLYAMESPECWFEDFGEGQLMGGSAEVRLDPDFGALVVADGYHVFITPYGESNGLFVADRNVSGFRVCEQHGGTSNVNFAYRVVAKRKDVVADRLARLTLPQNFPPVSSASP